jgi:hypothetical protein
MAERGSLWELCEENLVGGLPCWGPWKIVEKNLEMGISFHRDPAGGAHLLGTLRDGLKEL